MSTEPGREGKKNRGKEKEKGKKKGEVKGKGWERRESAPNSTNSGNKVKWTPLNCLGLQVTRTPTPSQARFHLVPQEVTGMLPTPFREGVPRTAGDGDQATTAPLHGTTYWVFWVQAKDKSVRKHLLEFSFSWRILLKISFFHYTSSRGAAAGPALSAHKRSSTQMVLNKGLLKFYCFSRLTLVCYFCSTALFSNL